MKRQDQLLAHMDAYAVDKETNALLLKHMGVAGDAKIVKSKLQAIDPVTKALLVKWVDSIPMPTGAEIVAVLEALTGDDRLRASAIRIVDAGDYFPGVAEVEAALAELATGVAIQNLAIKDYHIDWGVGANQVSAVDVPIADAGGFFVATDVEAALQELALAATITIADAGGYYAAANVEAALQELAAPTWLIGRLEAAAGDEWDQHFSNLLDPYGGVESWSGGAAVVPDGWTLAGAGAAVAREAGVVRHGNFSAKITRAAADCSLSRAIEEFTYYQNRKVTFGCWVYCSTANRARIQIADGVGTSESGYHTGGGSWEFLTILRTIDNAATSVTPHLRVDNGATFAYFDGAILVEGTICPTYMPAVKTVYLTTSLTDPAYDGDAFSDVEADLDLSAFGNGCPPKIKAVLMKYMLFDGGSLNNNVRIYLGPGGIPIGGAQANIVTARFIKGVANSRAQHGWGWVPCDSNGDIRYRFDASGVNTLFVHLYVWAYVLGE